MEIRLGPTSHQRFSSMALLFVLMFTLLLVLVNNKATYIQIKYD